MVREATKEELLFMKQASLMLELSTNTWATGVTLFHRYCTYTDKYESTGDEPLNPQICMVLCLYLATKVTEEPRKLRDMINTGYKLTNPNSEFLPVGDMLDNLSETMAASELVLLRALRFDTNIGLPHKWVAHILYGMAWWPNNGIPPTDTEDVDLSIKDVAKTAWGVANDCVMANLVDTDSAQRLGAACIRIALSKHNIPLPEKDIDEWAKRWSRSSGESINRLCRLIETRTGII